MRVLILTLGSRGDVQPFVALGAALRARGHDVALSTGRGFEAMIEAKGLTAAPLSDDVREQVRSPEIQQALRSFSGKVRAWRAAKGWFRRQLDEMWGVAQEVRPDVIVYHYAKALAAQHIAEALSIVAMPVTLIPALAPTSAFPSLAVPVRSLGPVGNRLSHQALNGLIAALLSGKVRAWRHESLDLHANYAGGLLDGYAPPQHPGGRKAPRFHAFSRYLVARPDDWAERDQVPGYWFCEPADGWEPPDSLARFLEAGPPPVYVGFGSMPSENAGKLTRIVVEALEAADMRGILASGWGGLDDSLRAKRIHFLESAPHDWLFPRCSAVVHHGGAGTTHEGLRWGRPSIVCPVFGDQPFWGRRVADIGAGPAPIPQKKLTPESLATALTAARSPAVVTRAEEIGTQIRAEPGTDAAVSAIEAFMAS